MSPTERATACAGLAAIVVLCALIAIAAAWHQAPETIIFEILVIAASITIGFQIGKLHGNA